MSISRAGHHHHHHQHSTPEINRGNVAREMQRFVIENFETLDQDSNGAITQEELQSSQSQFQDSYESRAHHAKLSTHLETLEQFSDDQLLLEDGITQADMQAFARTAEFDPTDQRVQFITNKSLHQHKTTSRIRGFELPHQSSSYEMSHLATKSSSFRSDAVLSGEGENLRIERYNLAEMQSDFDALEFEDGHSIRMKSAHEPDSDLHIPETSDVAEALSSLPPFMRGFIQSVTLSPVANPDDAIFREIYGTNEPSYMTARSFRPGTDVWSGNITIYPSEKPQTPERMFKSMVHEVGHLMSEAAWGQDTSNEKWQAFANAVELDGAASQYGETNVKEAFSEIMRTYMATKGTPEFAEHHEQFSNTFNLLEREFPQLRTWSGFEH